MNNKARKIKKKAFKKIKKILPKDTVFSIQRKRIEKSFLNKRKSGSYRAKNTYSIVSAVYNVEDYLDDFFESILNQTIATDNLSLILVDDGSTDNSANIIKQWKSNYPKLITYVHKENGGQASARNVGLEYVKTDWVTFIDPDDFVSQTYFEEVDKNIASHADLCFVSCRLLFFNELKGQVIDRHPLRIYYRDEVSLYNVTDDHMPITLSASKSFFKVSHIKKTGIRFSVEIKPNFEDAHFLNRYLLSQESGRAAFLRKPVYYYRKRGDRSSTIDSSWDRPEKVTTLLTKGMLNLLEYATRKRGYVPAYIQKTVLYDLQWHIKQFAGKRQNTQRFEDDGLSDVFWDNMQKIFDYIDCATIENISGKWLNSDLKFACLETFKKERPTKKYIRVSSIDYERSALQIRSVDEDYEIYCNGKRMVPLETKKTSVSMFGRNFYSIYFSWYDLPEGDDTLSYCSLPKNGTESVTLSVIDSYYKNSVPMSSVNSVYKKNWNKYPQDPSDYWLFMDRRDRADDNAEHLYRWVKNNHPETNAYFILEKESKDWKRLKADGFHLVPFGSKRHEYLLRRTSKIISSHADGVVHSYFGDNFYQSKKIVFLQHGVIKDDLSPWLNGKPINLMLTSSKDEYYSIIENESPYYLSSREVALTGLPRHDSLLERKPERRSILISPTWRRSLAGKWNGSNFEPNPSFSSSKYKEHWENLLNNIDLYRIATDNNLRIVFYPHPNIIPYVEKGYFSIPKYVEFYGDQDDTSIQQTFADSAVLITDYSSVAFEAAYLNRAIIYYHFDFDDFYSGMQVYAKGYFDYSENGFGPVVNNENELINELSNLAQNDFNPEEKYINRMNNCFEYRDGKCCERVYDCIMKLSSGNNSKQN